MEARTFRQLQSLLAAEVQRGRVIDTEARLFRTFAEHSQQADRASFQRWLIAAELQLHLRRLDFGGLVLLRPDLLEQIALRLVKSATQDPEGGGCLPLRDLDRPLEGFLDAIEPRHRNLLGLSSALHLLREDRALYLDDKGLPRLIVPDRVTRSAPDAPDPVGLSRVGFEGPALRIFSALVVRLSLSGVFTLRSLWRHGASWDASTGGLCQIALRGGDLESGALRLSFDGAAGRQTRRYFEDALMSHLHRVARSARRACGFVCAGCQTPVAPLQVDRRLARGFDALSCCVCDTRVSLLDPLDPLPGDAPSIASELDRAAEGRKARHIAALKLMGKRQVGDYDVLLVHLPSDRPAVLKVGEWLEEQGLLPWIDAWQGRTPLQGGVLDPRLDTIKAAAVVIGKDSSGPWEDPATDELLQILHQRRIPLIPVALPPCELLPYMPEFLDPEDLVDFRLQSPDPMLALIASVNGSPSDTLT